MTTGGTEGDTTAIHGLLDQLTQAWNRGDGAAYGAGFTRDATYITYVGTLYNGSADIAGAHQVLFDSFLKGTRLACDVLDIRFFGSDVAVVTTRGDTYKGKPGKLTKIQTYTLIRDDGGKWLAAAFQNTQHKSLLEAISFRLKPGTRPDPDR